MENGNIVASRLLLLLLGDSQSTSSYTRSIKTEEMGRVQSGCVGVHGVGAPYCTAVRCTAAPRTATAHRTAAPHSYSATGSLAVEAEAEALLPPRPPLGTTTSTTEELF
jgi:hypothetical protein